MCNVEFRTSQQMLQRGSLKKKKKRAKKSSGGNAGQLLPWLTRALDEEWFEGMRWYDRGRRIFYVNWTHKSAEHWSQSEIAFCEGWAAHKGKNIGKNAKQLKATFRCALNSKKELIEIKRTKTKRFWQFIDPSDHDRLKQIKLSKRWEEIFKPWTIEKEPQEDSLFVSFDSCGMSVEDNMSSPPSMPSTSLITVFKQEDLSDSGSPRSEDSRFSPPVEPVQAPTYQYPALATRMQQQHQDLWQPNFLAIPAGAQGLPPAFAQFPGALDELMRPAPPELDQFVPALEGFQTYPASTALADRAQGGQSLDEDYLLNFDVDPVACEKLIKELSRLTTAAPAEGVHQYAANDVR